MSRGLRFGIHWYSKLPEGYNLKGTQRQSEVQLQELRMTMIFRVCMYRIAFPGDTPLVAYSIPSGQPWNQVHRRHTTCTQHTLSVYLTIPEKKPCISGRS